MTDLKLSKLKNQKMKKSTVIRLYIKVLLFNLFILCLIFSGLSHAQTKSWSSEGPYGCWVKCMEIDLQNPEIIFAGTLKGIYKTTNGATNWSKTNFSKKQVTVIKIAPSNSNIVFAGTKSDGVFKSTDGGDTWQSAGMDSLVIHALCIDPDDSNVIYLGTESKKNVFMNLVPTGGIYKSVDGGASWAYLPFPSELNKLEKVTAIAVDPTFPDFICIGGYDLINSMGGIYTSSNKGISWHSHKLSGCSSEDCLSLEIIHEEHDLGTIIALVDECERGNVCYKGPFFGDSWTEICKGLGRSMKVDPNNPNYIYFGTTEAERNIVAFDQANKQFLYPETVPEGLTDPTAILVKPGNNTMENTTIYMGFVDVGVFKSIDWATTWSKNNVGINDLNIDDISINPDYSDRAVAAIDGLYGLAKKENEGSSWTVENFGYAALNVSSVAINPYDSDMIFCGLETVISMDYQGYLSYRFSDNNGVDWTNKDIYYVSPPHGFGWKYKMSEIAFSSSDPKIRYIADAGSSLASGGLYKTIDGGSNWSRKYDMGVTAMAISPSDQNEVYVGTSAAGYISRSVDGGNSWTTISPTGSGIWVDDVYDIEVTQNEMVLAATSNGLMKWSGGTNWTKISGIPTNITTSIVIDYDFSPNVIYVGTGTHGVYQSSNNGQTWTAFNDGLGSNLVNRLRISSSDPKMLYAATGEGVWTKQLETPTSKPNLIASYINFYPKIGMDGDEITVVVSIKNTGTANAGASIINYYLSTDTQISESDLLLGSLEVPALEPGATVDRRLKWTVNSDLETGFYYVGCLVDANNQVAESDEKNDFSETYSKFEKSETGLPDLELVSGDMDPTSGDTGDVLTLTAGIGNTGTASAGQSMVKFYLSEDIYLDGEDYYVGFASVPELDTGATFNSILEWTVTESLPYGTYNLIIDVDAEEQVEELYDGNLYRLVYPLFTKRSLPDLLAHSLNFSPTEGETGDELSVSATVQNAGSAESGTSVIRYYLSVDDEITNSDFLIGEDAVTVLSEGASSSHSISWIISDEIDVGSYFVGCIVDAANQVDESNEDNQFVVSDAKFQRIATAMPDLVAHSYSFYPSFGASGDEIRLLATVTNAGEVGAGSSTVWFCLSTDDDFTSADTKIGIVEVGPLMPNESEIIELSWIIPENMEEGNYKLACILDVDEVIAESDENNVFVLSDSHSLEISDQASPNWLGWADGGLSFELRVNHKDSTIEMVKFLFDDWNCGDVRRSGSLSISSIWEVRNNAFVIDESNTIYGDHYISGTISGDGIHASGTWELTYDNISCSGDWAASLISGYPDLVIRSIDFTPLFGLSGDQLATTIEVNNAGNSESWPNVLKCYLSTDQFLSDDDMLLWSGDVDTLTIGESILKKGNWTIPEDFEQGLYYMGGVIDVDGELEEIDEDNNEFWTAEQFEMDYPPEMDSCSPDGISIANTQPKIKMYFNEEVYVGSGALHIYQVEDDLEALSIGIKSFDLNAGTITKGLDPGLNKNTEYYILVDAGFVQDANGNDFSGINDKTKWTFTTGIPSSVISIHEQSLCKVSVHPVEKSFSVRFYEPPGNYTMSLYDSLGRLLIHEGGAAQFKRIETNAFASGVYVLTIQNKDMTIQGKIVLP